MRSLLVALSLVMATNAFSQDSLLMKAIESAASRNYDRIKKTHGI